MSIRSLISRVRVEPRPLRFLLSRVLWQAGVSRRFTVRRNGYRVRFHPSAVSAAIWSDPGFESSEEEFVAAMLRPGDTYVDVGANVGMLSLRAATVVGSGGRVVAIEAHPRTVVLLRDNVALNDFRAIQVVHTAVGDTSGTVSFSDYRSDDQNHVVEGTDGVAVPVQRLDVLVPPGPVALLKVDVEGFELPVFRGAPEVLARTRAVLFESWDTHAARFGHTTADVLALLAGKGFTLFRLQGRQLVPLAGLTSSPSCENLVALRDPDDAAALLDPSARGR